MTLNKIYSVVVGTSPLSLALSLSLTMVPFMITIEMTKLHLLNLSEKIRPNSADILWVEPRQWPLFVEHFEEKALSDVKRYQQQL